MIYKTLHDIGINIDLQNTIWLRDKQWSRKHCMTEGQIMIYNTLHAIGTNNDLQSTIWHREKQLFTKHYMT